MSFEVATKKETSLNPNSLAICLIPNSLRRSCHFICNTRYWSIIDFGECYVIFYTMVLRYLGVMWAVYRHNSATS